MLPLQFPEYTAGFIRALATHGYRTLTGSPECRSIHQPVPPTRFDEDASEEVDALDDPGYLLSCRQYDRDLILAAHGSLEVRDNDTVSVAGLGIQWGKRMARLKTWGGQQSLGALITDRIEALLPWAGKKPRKKQNRRTKAEIEMTETATSSDSEQNTETADDSEIPPAAAPKWQNSPAMLHMAALKGISGIIPGHARVNGIDMGFSPAGKVIALNPWLELLVLIGVEYAPIAIIPSRKYEDGYFAVYSEGLWYEFFRRVRIEPYYYAWDSLDDRGMLPHQFAKMIDPSFSPGPFDDLQIPKHLLDNPDMLWNEIERLKRIAGRDKVGAA